MNRDQISTLRKWRARSKRSQLAHGYTAISYGRYHLFLGVLLILLTTASSVLIFAKEVEPSWLSPTVAVSAALFAYLQTFLRLSEKANSHREFARKYGTLKKETEYLLDFESADSEITTKVDSLRTKGDVISSNAPHALSHRWKEAKKETQKENDFESIRSRT